MNKFIAVLGLISFLNSSLFLVVCATAAQVPVAPARPPGTAANNPFGLAPKLADPTPIPTLPSFSFSLTPIPDEIQFELRRNDDQTAVWDKWPGGEQRVADTMRLPMTTHYFHWLDADDHAILKAQGGYDKRQFEELYQFTVAKPEAQGPGFYASLSPIDSSSYGPRVLMGTAPDDLLIAFSGQLYSTTVNGNVLGNDIIGVSERLRKIGVDGLIGDRDQNWMVFINQRAVKKLQEPTARDLLEALEKENVRAKMMEYKFPDNAGFAQGMAKTVPIAGVQTFYEKGYGIQAPNDWTRGHAPAWDKVLRAETLTANEAAIVADDVKPQNANVFDSSTNLGKYSKQDPHLQNLINYFEQEAKRIGTPEVIAKVDDYLQRQEAYTKAINDYYQSADYKAYALKSSAYYQSAAYQQYMNVISAFPTSPANVTYQALYKTYTTSPAFKAYQANLIKYRQLPTYVSYQAAVQKFYASPAYSQWVQQLTANPSTRPPMPASMPVLPPGMPLAPPGAPVAPTWPLPPDGAPVPPDYPTIESPNPSELGADELTVFHYRKISEQLKADAVDGEFKPTPLPTRMPADQKAFRKKLMVGCIRTFFGR